MTFCGESWSLAVEEWFYLLFPVFLYLALKVTRSFAVAILSTACLFGVYSLAFRLHGATIPEYSWSLQQRMLVTMRFDALMVGVLGACWWYYHQALWLRLRWIAFLLGLVALGIVYYSLYWGDNAGLFAKVWRFSLTSVGFLLLFPLASQWRTLWPQWAAKLIRLLALSSYVLYLTHGIWNTWMDLLPGAAPKSVAGGYYLFTEKVLGSVLFACLIYWVIERPLMRFRDRVSPGSVPRPQSYSNEPSR